MTAKPEDFADRDGDNCTRFALEGCRHLGELDDVGIQSLLAPFFERCGGSADYRHRQAAPMVLAIVGDNVETVGEDVEIVLFAVTRAARDPHPVVRSACAVSVREAVTRFLGASDHEEDVDVSGFLEPLHLLLADVEASVCVEAAIAMREILLQDTRSYMPSFNALMGCIESTANATVKEQCMVTLSIFFEGKKKVKAKT